MSRFLDLFPKIPYDINKKLYSDFQNITDLTFRFGIIKEAIDNTSAYYEYTIKEDETPEILADRVYGSPEAYWIILYANNILDAQFDWPMSYVAFEKYIKGKYGSITNAKEKIHHYEKVVARQVDDLENIYIDRQTVDYDSPVDLVCTMDNINVSAYVGQLINQYDSFNATVIFEGTIASIDTVNKKLTLNINKGKLQNFLELQDVLTPGIIIGKVLYNTQENYEFYLNLPQEPQYTTYTINNKRVIEAITRNAISCYDHELEVNDSKRQIRIIKRDYYGQIQKEFYDILKAEPKFIRKLK